MRKDQFHVLQTLKRDLVGQRERKTAVARCRKNDSKNMSERRGVNKESHNMGKGSMKTGQTDLGGIGKKIGLQGKAGVIRIKNRVA